MKLVLPALALVLAAAPDAPAPGYYNADTPHHPGFIQLHVEKDGQVTFLHVVTIHLPPYELERHKARLVKKEGKLCMEPAPHDVAPCLSRDKDGQWQLALLSPAKVLTLVREPPETP